MPAKRKRAPGAGRPKGPPKKKIGLKLLVASCDWLDRQPDKSAAVDGLIAEAAAASQSDSAAHVVGVPRIVRLLLAAGWSPDGETKAQTVRIPTQASPLFGGSGGELAAFGGRQRYRKGDRRVTVGKRTTFFWTLGPSPNAKHLDTMHDLAAIEVEANDQRVAPAGSATPPQDK